MSDRGADPRTPYGRSAGRWPSFDRVAIAIAAAAAAATVAVIGWGTRPVGPGLYGDGAAYLSAAESIVRSGHLSVIGAPYWSNDSLMPMRQWPPGFSIAIAAPLRAGFSLMTAAVFVQMVAAAVIAVLTALMVARLLSPGWAALTALAILVTPAVLRTEMNIVSEPLYTACLATLLALMTWRPTRPLLSGLLAAAMVMIRYLGIAAVAGAGLWALIQPARPGQRIRRALTAFVPGVAAYEAWSLVVRHSGGTIGSGVLDRQVGPIVRAFVGSVGSWLAPWANGVSSLHVGAKVCILALAAASLLLAHRSRAHDEARRLADADDASLRTTRARFMKAASVLALCHLAVLLVARVLTSSVEFSARTFAPVYYLFTLMGVVAVGIAWSARGRVRGLAVAAATVWLVGGIAATRQVWHEARIVGLDHARTEERSSATIAWLAAHANGMPIYTNEPAKIYFHLRRAARSLPWIVTADTLRHLREVLSQRPGYVVWFAGGLPSAYVPRPLLANAISLDKLRLGARLSDVIHLDDGDIMVRDTAVSKVASCCLIQTAGSPP